MFCLPFQVDLQSSRDTRHATEARRSTPRFDRLMRFLRVFTVIVALASPDCSGANRRA